MNLRRMKWVALAVGAAAVVAVGAAMAATAATRTSGTVKTGHSASYGMVLVSSTGFTLYRYLPDSKGVARCTGACSAVWPPLLATGKPTAGTGAKAGLLGTIARPGGGRQVTYGGFPLYRFSGDSKAGQTNGEGYVGKWYVVNASGALVKHRVSSKSGGGWG